LDIRGTPPAQTKEKCIVDGDAADIVPAGGAHARLDAPARSYYVASVTLMICALLWMCWTGNLGGLSTWLHLTGQRVVGTIAITSAFGVAQPASSLLARAPDAHAPVDERATLMAEWLGVTGATPAGRSRVSPAQSRSS
jgi:hypothetical protein